MKAIIRQEASGDYPQVFKIIEEAFKNDEYSDQSEPYLVEKLRKSTHFIPELSIVAQKGNEIIGHILLTKVTIENENNSFDSLALAPVTVKPEFQRQGFGKKLIKRAHKKAKRLGFRSIVLIGHADYYPQFGYELASKYNIKFPFEAPDENCMVIALTKKGLKGVSGTVKYPKEFDE